MKNTGQLKWGPALILIIICSQALAQTSVPIFADRVDSVAYVKLDAAIMEFFRAQRAAPTDESRSRLDSLLQLQRGFKDRIIGYKVIYRPHREFTTYDDLKSGKIKPEEITKLSLADSPLKALPKEIFSCTNLTELELVNTRIRKLPSRLGKLPKLRSIYVYNNMTSGRIRLGRIATVRTLLIRGVRENTLPGSYMNFKSLEALDLSANIGLSHFPNIYRNRNLKKLNLLENNITLADLKNRSGLPMEELNLMKNRIRLVPDAIASFSNLNKLTLNYNEIENVSPAIGKLRKLETLSFYQNKLTAVPAQVFELTNLKSIDLYYNQIRELSPDIVRLENLRILYLANNQLTTLPDHLGKLGQLRELYLHNNKLSALPESVKDMKELRVLRINNNYFTAFPPSVLALTNLENLDISRNYLYRFPVELSQFTKLEILAVLNNPWENMEDVERVSGELQAKGTVVQTK